MNTTAKYPQIKIRLVGEDGNAFSILARCQDALKRNGLRDEVSAFHAEATSGDYGHLLRTVMDWFSVDTDEDTCSNCGEYDCFGGDCYQDDDEETVFSLYGCHECGEMYAVGGCPACGDGY